MSGKHIKATAWRVARGTPVLSVAIGLLAWVAVAAALVLLPSSSTNLLEGSQRPESDRQAAGTATGQTPSSDGAESPGPTPTARQRPTDDPSTAPNRSGDRTASTTPAPEDEETNDSDEASPWADNPGRAEEHRKKGHKR